MPRKQHDAFSEETRREVAAMLAGGKSGSLDELRVDMISTLVTALRTEQVKTSPDVRQITQCIDALSRLLPSLDKPPPEGKHRAGDPAERLAQIVTAAILTTGPDGIIVSEQTELDRLRRENEALQNELAALRGAPRRPTQLLLGPPSEQPMPPASNEAAPASNEAAGASNEAPKPAGPKTYHGPNGETWTEPGPNEPPGVRPTWLTQQQMDRANNRGLPADLGSCRADRAGGSAGLSVNGTSQEPWRPFVEPSNSGFFWRGSKGRAW